MKEAQKVRTVKQCFGISLQTICCTESAFLAAGQKFCDSSYWTILELLCYLGHHAIMAEHQGTKTRATRITEEFFFPGMPSDIKRYVKSCDICQRTIPNAQKGRVRHEMLIIALSLQRVVIDFNEPSSPSSRKGNQVPGCHGA